MSLRAPKKLREHRSAPPASLLVLGTRGLTGIGRSGVIHITLFTRLGGEEKDLYSFTWDIAELLCWSQAPRGDSRTWDHWRLWNDNAYKRSGTYRGAQKTSSTRLGQPFFFTLNKQDWFCLSLSRYCHVQPNGSNASMAGHFGKWILVISPAADVFECCALVS